MTNETLYFKTNTLLKNLIGKDLINQDNIAIVELVKNSYDANSPLVKIEFTDFTKSNKAEYRSTDDSKIIIFDEGCGMNLDDIKDKWLNIAYSEKSELNQGTGNYLAGNKGIGRFSCDRLGAELNLLTRKENNEILHLYIKWSDFEKTGNKDLVIQKIPLHVKSLTSNELEKITGKVDFPSHGTSIIISKLRSAWNTEKLRELKADLEKFINPNQLFLREKFKIYLSVPSIKEDSKDYQDRINVIIQNKIFDKLKFNSTYIDSKISDDNKTIHTKLFHEGDKVFDLIEHNTDFKLITGAHIVIYYLNPYKKAYFKRQTGVRSVDFGSIFLFLNGFRIAPYGDRSDDWLGLDVRKAQGTQRYLSSRDIVGRIEITGSEVEFKPISSREGLKETASFSLLREVFFITVLRKLEKFVVDGLNWDSVPNHVRKEVRDSEGLDWNKTKEEYKESKERKYQRIALSIMTYIGSSPDKIISFWFNPSLLEDVIESREEEVIELISDIEGFEGDKADKDLLRNLSKIKKIIAKKESEAKEAKEVASDLRVEVAEQAEKIKTVESQKEIYKAQTYFLEDALSKDISQLILYLHQIKLDTIVVDNYLKSAIKFFQERDTNNTFKDGLSKIYNAMLNNRQIATVSQIATKAGFRSELRKEDTDIPAYIEQYITQIAKENSASGLDISIDNQIKELFSINVSRPKLSMLIDNIINNAQKAEATKLQITMNQLSSNRIEISISDNGNGLSSEISDIDSIFNMGVTTTNGSGLGLYHAKQIISEIDGKISAIPRHPKGMTFILELTK